MTRKKEHKAGIRPIILLAIALLCSLTVSDSLFAQTLTQRIFSDSGKKVLVAAHRGDWSNFPENSIPGIVSCIENGIDIVEIDVQESKDGKFVLMHDATVNRTTNGKGKVSSLSYQTLINLKLRDRNGQLTEHTVPGLDTILKLAKDKILVNIDKSAGRFDKLLKVIDSLDCGGNVILKGTAGPSYFKKMKNQDSTGTTFMPIIYSGHKNLDSFLLESGVPLIEHILRNDTNYYCTTPGLKKIKDLNCRIWYNALFSGISGGHNESSSAIHAWNWFIDHQAYIIQTDYPFHLMTHLINSKLHSPPSGFISRDLSRLPNQKIKEKPVVQNDSGSLANAQKIDGSDAQTRNVLQAKAAKPKTKEAIKNIADNGKPRKPAEKFYIIRQGDSLYEIARKYRCRISNLLKLNKGLREADVIRPGQKIRVS